MLIGDYSDLLAGGSVVIAVLTFAAFLRGAAWWLDLLTHFRVHYFAASAILAGALLAMGHQAAALFSAAVGAVNLLAIAHPLLKTRRRSHRLPPARARRLKIATLNLYYYNTRYAAVREFLQRAHPDIVLLQEVTHDWARELDRLADEFPHRLLRENHDNWDGVGLLARSPWQSAEFIGRLGTVDTAVIRARFRDFTVLTVKTLAPKRSGWTSVRDQQLAELGKLAAQSPQPVIVAGDFNAAPWSRGYAKFLQHSRLIWQSAGCKPGWPARFGWLGVPIDHILVSAPLRVIAPEVGPYVGSDHRPLLAFVGQD